MNKNHIGLTLGSLFGLGHLGWVILIALGWGQACLDFVLHLHMFASNPFQVGSFDLLTAVELVVFTFIVGYVVGWIFALIWNAVSGK